MSDRRRTYLDLLSGLGMKLLYYQTRKSVSDFPIGTTTYSYEDTGNPSLVLTGFSQRSTIHNRVQSSPTSFIILDSGETYDFGWSDASNSSRDIKVTIGNGKVTVKSAYEDDNTVDSSAIFPDSIMIFDLIDGRI